MKTSERLLLGNIIQAAASTLRQTAQGNEDTTIRSTVKRMGRELAHEDSIAIELKNRLTTGV